MDNAVSTLVVRALSPRIAGAPRYWLRKVKVVTLAEAFFHFRHAEFFKKIYEVWLEGRVVIHKRPKRGTSGGKRIR